MMLLVLIDRFLCVVVLLNAKLTLITEMKSQRLYLRKAKHGDVWIDNQEFHQVGKLISLCHGEVKSMGFFCVFF